ncbi:261_t:CDS:2 [Dentiscutata erythropus]|uniref:261_t:CDS:1 n=1 Tax=Dentiscutata erythropus TaxID=1348616 RepID=A0A9N9FAU0_9GLOM|nr:261_t:CDS:2 [Dentiscutata erythropus]
MENANNNRLPPTVTNPWKLVTSLNRTQAITFIAAYLGWTLDAFDFFTVSFALPYIAEEFHMKPSDISSSITVTLMLRPVGALIFGILTEKYGRKYPLMADIILYSVVELASGFAPNFAVFIILRGIFGIAMGGEWGSGAALTMEILPPETRGLFSGILQQGYATGYIVASLFYYIVLINLGWRALFWIGSFPALLVILIRFVVPESPVWEKMHNRNAFTCTQDLYPTFLKTQLMFSPAEITVIVIIANIGSIIGGTVCGYASQYLGRRRTIILAVIMAGAFLPLFVLPRNKILLGVGAFFLYFFVQGAWGIVPAHLNEISPPSCRGIFPGLTYQLGVLIASCSAQIEAVLGEKLSKNGIPDYGITQAVLTAIAAFSLIVMISFGTEDKSIDFEKQLENENYDLEGHGNITVLQPYDKFNL